MEEYSDIIEPCTGFLTYGNATLLLFDKGVPLLATDPWIDGSCYFGSWSLPVSPSRSLINDLGKTKYVWISHGHPDHLHVQSLKKYLPVDVQILLPDHYGLRIYRDLSSAGFRCNVLTSGKIYSLSDNIRIACFPDYYQDSILVAHIGGIAAVVNLNDSQSILQRRKVLPLVNSFEDRFVLKLVNFGDTDIMTYCDEDWNIIPPPQKQDYEPLGTSYVNILRKWNCNITSPFSASHIYSHPDTLWLSSLVAAPEDHSKAFDETKGLLIPAYFYYEATTRSVTPIAYPSSNTIVEKLISDTLLKPPINTRFSGSDIQLATNYFHRIERLRHRYKALTFYSKENSFSIDISADASLCAEFSYPSSLLMKSIKSRTFDNLLISNIGRVRLSDYHQRLHPAFSIPVTRFGDNANCFNRSELRRYRNHYLGFYKSSFFVIFLQDLVSLHLHKIIRRTPFFPLFRTAWRTVLKWL